MNDGSKGTTSAQRIAELVSHLVDGWHEQIEYYAPVEQGIERRVKNIKQKALIAQLLQEVSGYGTNSMGDRWGKPGSRPPGTLDIMALIDDIDRWLWEHAACSATSRTTRLRSLVTIATGRDETEWADDVTRQLRRYIKTARIMLGYDVPTRKLRDIGCGDCGGTLIVAIDVESDIHCTACPKRYTRWEWVDLVMD